MYQQDKLDQNVDRITQLVCCVQSHLGRALYDYF